MTACNAAKRQDEHGRSPSHSLSSTTNRSRMPNATTAPPTRRPIAPGAGGLLVAHSPDGGDQTVRDALLILSIAGQLPSEQSLLVQQAPDDHRRKRGNRGELVV